MQQPSLKQCIPLINILNGKSFSCKQTFIEFYQRISSMSHITKLKLRILMNSIHSRKTKIGKEQQVFVQDTETKNNIVKAHNYVFNINKVQKKRIFVQDYL